MTVVFSGNGMSLAVADMLGGNPAGADSLGFVFPVYGWRIPKILRRRIREGFGDFRPSFTWAVMTCGDDVGMADEDLERELRASAGVGLDAAYSVVMPDTYIGLPGFSVDSDEEARAKTDAARGRCREIAAALAERRCTRDLRRGRFAAAKTRVAGALFDRLFANDRLFRVDASKCTGCGRCAAECPTDSILSGPGGVPSWRRSGGCTACFHCCHACPAAAIESGPFTRGKRRLGVSTCAFRVSSV